jgi:serine/threonine protein phosphatase PrpC
MTVLRSTAFTDTGRKRRRNEDSFVCEPPLFAVADGMGGAQAGEIASRLAAGSLTHSEPSAAPGQERVVAMIQEANRSVYERASEDEAVSGMGTTMTIALVDEDNVCIGHVGDSRAYLVRDGRLEQLTEDHSLVAELVRSGKLSPEEAETHPHRSVITRALGTDPEVEVDSFCVASKSGDVFMLCSDGLTSMVHDEAILSAVEEHRGDLDSAAARLVEEANRAGGEDNITVVLFEFSSLEDTMELPLEVLAPVAGDEDTLSELDGVPTLPGPDGVATLPGPPGRAATAAPSRRRRIWRIVLPAVAVLLVALAAGAIFGLSRAHFVGAQRNGHVAVYQGVPWNLPFGIHLYRVVYESPLLAVQLSRSERRKLFDHDLRSEGNAIGEVKGFESEVVQ